MAFSNLNFRIDLYNLGQVFSMLQTQSFLIFAGNKMLEQLRLIKWICTYLFVLVTLSGLLWYPLYLHGL
jgi:hypothetical protein